jgi:hypothetical protein
MTIPGANAGSSPQCSSHLAAIQRSIGLRARRLHCRSPRAIEQAKLNPCAIDYPTHYSSQGIDLAHQVTFGDSPIAGLQDI